MAVIWYNAANGSTATACCYVCMASHGKVTG
jgi:hypothetical protein